MQKTVREIIEMINNGTLHYNQSTQRKFIYATMDALLPSGSTSKAGSLINAILEENIQLPAVYFWYNTDTNQLNIHDGKQRILSLYYFINPTSNCNISTIRNGKATTWDGLSQEDQDKLLNYTLDIVERKGTSSEEERSFYLINTNSVNLTNYECISGMLHGTFLTEFERYIDSKHNVLDKVKKIERGEQAYKFLLAMFNISNAKQAKAADKSLKNLTTAIHAVRDSMFEPKAYNFDEILETFNELLRAVPKLKEETALALSAETVRAGYNTYDIINHYRTSIKGVNDITSWDLDTHRTFIKAYVLNNLKLDPQRYFGNDVKDTLFKSAPRCAHINADGTRCTESAYNKLEVDHIIPWCEGGRTTIDNAQLLCKKHNASKGAKED